MELVGPNIKHLPFLAGVVVFHIDLLMIIIIIKSMVFLLYLDLSKLAQKIRSGVVHTRTTKTVYLYDVCTRNRKTDR